MEGESDVKKNSQCCYGVISMFVNRVCKAFKGMQE